jgi:hypothetical protein
MKCPRCGRMTSMLIVSANCTTLVCQICRTLEEPVSVIRPIRTVR